MQDVETALKELSEVQGTQINELLDLVRQNKEINEGMRVCSCVIFNLTVA
jgi:hypothetical protein